MQAAKKTIRSRALKQRDDYTENLNDKEKARLLDRIFQSFSLAFTPKAGTTVAGYWPMGSEVDCKPLLDHLWSMECRMCLPYLTGGEDMVFRLWRPGDTLKPNIYGIGEPLPSAESIDPDIVIVPLVSFDRRGHRLGYGAGYYDRALARLRKRKSVTVIGLALEMQQVNELPIAKYDQPLDMVATEDRLYRFA